MRRKCVITSYSIHYTKLYEGGSSAIEPGGSALFRVRYRPTTASDLDRDRVRIALAEEGGPYDIDLKGRASLRNWQFVSLGEGTVIDIRNNFV